MAKTKARLTRRLTIELGEVPGWGVDLKQPHLEVLCPKHSGADDGAPPESP